jgi:hypothetical protein
VPGRRRHPRSASYEMGCSFTSNKTSRTNNGLISESLGPLARESLSLLVLPLHQPAHLIWRWSGRKRSWRSPLGTIMINASQDTNQKSPEYKWELLPLQLTCFANGKLCCMRERGDLEYAFPLYFLVLFHSRVSLVITAEGLSWQFHFAALQLMAYQKQIRFLRVPPGLCIAVWHEHRGRPLLLRLCIYV